MKISLGELPNPKVLRETARKILDGEVNIQPDNLALLSAIIQEARSRGTSDDLVFVRDDGLGVTTTFNVQEVETAISSGIQIMHTRKS